MRHYARKRDANEPEIVAALRAAGATVQPLEPGAGGVPDLLVGFRGVTTLIEVKNRAGRGARRVTRPNSTEARQAAFREAWTGSPVHVVETVEQALAAIDPEPQDPTA